MDAAPPADRTSLRTLATQASDLFDEMDANEAARLSRMSAADGSAPRKVDWSLLSASARSLADVQPTLCDTGGCTTRPRSGAAMSEVIPAIVSPRGGGL